MALKTHIIEIKGIEMLVRLKTWEEMAEIDGVTFTIFNSLKCENKHFSFTKEMEDVVKDFQFTDGENEKYRLVNVEYEVGGYIILGYGYMLEDWMITEKFGDLNVDQVKQILDDREFFKKFDNKIYCETKKEELDRLLLNFKRDFTYDFSLKTKLLFVDEDFELDSYQNPDMNVVTKNLKDNGYTKVKLDEQGNWQVVEKASSLETPETSVDSESEITQCTESENTEIQNQDEIIKQNLETAKRRGLINRQHIVHYLKFQLEFDKDVSIRFYYVFQDKNQFKGKWVLKHHTDKHYEELTKEFAMFMIEKYCKVPVEEIIGMIEFGKYRKIRVSDNKLIREYE